MDREYKGWSMLPTGSWKPWNSEVPQTKTKRQLTIYLEARGNKKFYNNLVYLIKIGESCKAVPHFYPRKVGFLF